MRLPKGLLQAVLTALVLAVAGGAWNVYMNVHDLERDVLALQRTVDWLYRYTVPTPGSPAP